MNLEEAKKLFFFYSCSKFEMGKENPSDYKLYSELNIGKEVENKWREEQLNRYLKNINNENTDQRLWLTFSKMYDLAEIVKTEESILIMRKTVMKLKGNLTESEKVIIAEIIIGRKARSCRSGLIYFTYDLGDKANACLFASDSFVLLDNNFSESDLQKRADNAKVICISIMEELSLSRANCN